jgi:hypothetical protein
MSGVIAAVNINLDKRPIKRGSIYFFCFLPDRPDQKDGIHSRLMLKLSPAHYDETKPLHINPLLCPSWFFGVGHWLCSAGYFCPKSSALL